MIKSYTFALDPIGVLLSLPYIFALIIVLSYSAKLMNVRFSAKVITSLFLYYYLFFILGMHMSFIPNLPDTKLFAEMVTENFFPDSQSLGVRLFYVGTFPLRILSLFKLEIFITFQIFSFLLAIMILWKSWQIVLEHNGYGKSYGLHLFLVLVLMYPAFLLYIPVPLREFFILLGFSVLVYGLVDKYYNNNGNVAIVLGAILLIMGRPQFMVIVVLFTGIFQKNIYVRYGILLISIVVIPLLYSMVFSYKFTPEYFAYLRGELISTYEALSYGRVEWYSYADMLKDIPLLTLQFLLSPFPILHQHNPLNFLSIFIDAIFSIVMYVSAIYAGLKVSKVYLLIFLVSAILFSIWEFYIPGASRHRMPLVAMLLPVASFGMLKFYNEIKARL